MLGSIVFGLLLVGGFFATVVYRVVRDRSEKIERRGFEVKLNAGTTSAEQKKENDHG